MPSNPNLSLQRNERPSGRALFEALVAGGDRRTLGRVITELEAGPALALNDCLFGWEAPKPWSCLAVSGAPGVGKSTFIEAFGRVVLGRGHRLAVLAVDPSSAVSGGSILGDKTRMESLSREENAFIRPSPTAGNLGGVEANTRAAAVACAVAGYDFVILETVGVGQAEFRARDIADAFLLLAQPAAGDELQGIKRGILELADLVVVNKADRLAEAAKETARQLRQSLHLAPARVDGWAVKTLTVSALTGEGIEEIYALLDKKLGADAGARVNFRARWLAERFRTLVERRTGAFLTERREQSDGLSRLIDESTSLSAATDVLLAEFFNSKH